MIQLPNLFDYATSELSQDAFICWLSAWANSQYKEIDPALHQVSISFLQRLLEKHDVSGKEEVIFPLKHIEIKRQYKNIDVLIVVKDQKDSTFIILVEDKVGSGAHSGQLERYYNTIIDDKDKDKDKGYRVDAAHLYPIYINTHNVNHRLLPNSDKYAGFYRIDFLRVLEKYVGNNEILKSFYQYLLVMEKETNSYQKLSKNKWSKRAWEGFFMALKERLQTGNWRYVNNPSGGFYGFYFSSVPVNISGENIGSIYILLQQAQLNIKLGLASKSHGKARGVLRNRVYRELKEKLGHSFKKPDNFGSGQDMTVLVYSEDYIDTASIDFEKITKKLIDISESIKALADSVIIDGKEVVQINI